MYSGPQDMKVGNDYQLLPIDHEPTITTTISLKQATFIITDVIYYKYQNALQNFFLIQIFIPSWE